MSEAVELDETTLTQRVVLAGLADLSARGETPAHAGEIRAVCRDALDGVEADVVGGTPTEAEVSRALNRLDATDLVEGSRDETSVTGKGRPKFRPAADPAALLDRLADDGDVSPVVERVGSRDG